MKRIAFVLAVLVAGACSKGEKAASTPAADTASHMMMSDSTHMMMGDTTKPK